jgi:hypothetical protein
MDETQLRLDGNAVAGLLQELFVPEVTTTRGACASCGAISEMGAVPVYMYPHAPGAVLRCGHCETVLMVLVHGGEHVRLGLPGLAWLETSDVEQ